MDDAARVRLLRVVYTFSLDAGMVLVLAKHIRPRTDSSVAYYDLARAIDGSADATPDQLAGSLLSACESRSGMMRVKVDKTDPAYNTTAYKASGAKLQDIIIKLVRAPDW